ncbi:transmembrane protein 11, mitochondrial-like [Centruroides vittatus]|uniref:transmembrane protein 11, mitochondrial-like n=1 Tax=Centruroides vittatus TaxID=120091 RepID=UPI00350F0626
MKRESRCKRIVSKSIPDSSIAEIKDKLKQQGIFIVFSDHVNWDGTSETADNEMERAMGLGARIIIIEPPDIGEMASVWIVFGNFLHKLIIVSGLSTLATAYYWPEKPFLYGSLGTFTFLCTSIYGFAWQFDPCSKYKVEKDPVNRSNLPLHYVSTRCPTVLIKESSYWKTFCRIVVPVSAIGLCAWNLYKLHKSGTFVITAVKC